MNNPAPAPAPDRGPAGPETIKAKVAVGNMSFQLKAYVGTGSPLSTVVAASVLVAVSCFVMGVASLIGVPAPIALIAGLGAPAGAYLLIHVTCRHPRQSGSGRHVQR
jgi:hypothetical protein